jgi:hypothetical protein
MAGQAAGRVTANISAPARQRLDAVTQVVLPLLVSLHIVPVELVFASCIHTGAHVCEQLAPQMAVGMLPDNLRQSRLHGANLHPQRLTSSASSWRAVEDASHPAVSLDLHAACLHTTGAAPPLMCACVHRLGCCTGITPAALCRTAVSKGLLSLC